MMVVRQNTLTSGPVWMQRDGSWGEYKTARRFADQDKADAGARAAGHEVFGLFPVGKGKRAAWH